MATERAFSSDADRRQLLALRCVALRRQLEALSLQSAEQQLRLIQELTHFAQASDTMALPLAPGVRTELERQVTEHDPALKGEPLDRVFDLLDILGAPHWPLPWYAEASHDIDATDRSRIEALVAAYVAAASARDEVAAMALYATEGDVFEMARLGFRRHLVEAGARVEPVHAAPITARFDARRALVGHAGQPALRLLEIAGGAQEVANDVCLSVVRSAGGWRLG